MTEPVPNSASGDEALSTTPFRRKKRKLSFKQRRLIKRARQQEERQTNLKSIHLKRKSEAQAQAQAVSKFNLQEAPVSVTAWSGTRQEFSDGTPGVDELLRAGMTYVAWNGVETKPILDSDGHLFVLLAGSPRDQAGWDGVRRDMEMGMEMGRKRLRLASKHENHRRGDFPALTEGSYFGGGAKARLELC